MWMRLWQILLGDLSGADTSQNVMEAYNGALKRSKSPLNRIKPYECLTVRVTTRAEINIDFNELWICMIYIQIYRKSNLGDNRVITSTRSNLRCSLPPRCRLETSLSWRRFNGLICSITKVSRELGSERRETVWFLCRMSRICIISVCSTQGFKQHDPSFCSSHFYTWVYLI